MKEEQQAREAAEKALKAQEEAAAQVKDVEQALDFE